MHASKEQIIWFFLRISLGFILLWAFLDKVFGLGFSTSPEKSWLAGVSPTESFLTSSTKGPLGDIFKSLAGSGAVDWLFMMGLLLIGLSLILGIGIQVASKTGALLMLLMWSSMLPPKGNPIIDQHIVYLFVFLGLPYAKAGHVFGLGKWWSETAFVKKYPFLE